MVNGLDIILGQNCPGRYDFGIPNMHESLCLHSRAIIGAATWDAGGHRENLGSARASSSQGNTVRRSLKMATALADEIDVLAKAKREIGGAYVPSNDEAYMSEAQQDYFRRLLLGWKRLILDASAGTLQQLQDGPIRDSDLNDRASSETDWGLSLIHI